MLSRVLGYVRDLLLASILGAAGSSDAFIIALRIPNLLRASGYSVRQVSGTP